jgi:hypothetical protein
MTPMRKAIAEHMVLSKRTSAHVNTVFEVDMDPIVKLREAHRAEFQKREGIPLTYTPFFVKALVETVREFPVVNSSVSGENIIYKKAINVGIAVALDTGLIVPVINDQYYQSRKLRSSLRYSHNQPAAGRDPGSGWHRETACRCPRCHRYPFHGLSFAHV